MNKQHRIRIPSPREIYRRILIPYTGLLFSPRFVENVLIIQLNRGRRSPAQIDRRIWLGLYRTGFLPIKPLVRSAQETFGEKDFAILMRSLERKKKTTPNVDTVICHLDDVGALAHCNADEASKRVTAYMRERGVRDWRLTADAYRKRVERMRRDGVKLGSDK